MGLKNATSVQQRHIDRIFASELFKSIVVFVDDITVYSNTFEEHMDAIERAFNVLRDHGHSARLDKCHFFKEEIEILGYVVNSLGIKPSDRLVSGIRNLEVPKTLK